MSPGKIRSPEPSSPPKNLDGFPYGSFPRSVWYKEADYIIGMDENSEVVSINGKTGAITHREPSNTNANKVVKSTVDDLVDIGGKIILAVDLDFSDEVLVDGQGQGQPEKKIIIEGLGRTVITQKTRGSAIFKFLNHACFSLRNLLLQQTDGFGSVAALILSKDGTDELSCRNSDIDEVYVQGGHTDHALVLLQNFFFLNVGRLTIDANGQALKIENDSPDTNYGNSNFGYVRAFGGSGCVGVEIVGTNFSPIFIHFDYLYCSHTGTTTGLLLKDGARYISVDYILAEFFTVNGIYMEGSEDKLVIGNHINDGYVSSTETDAKAVWCNDFTGGNSVNLSLCSSPNGKVVDNDGGHPGEGNRPNSFSWYDGNELIDADYDFRAGAQSIINIWSTTKRMPNHGSSTVADGGTITHNGGLTPNHVHLTGTDAGEIVTVTAISSTQITVAIKDNDGTPGTEQTVYWSIRLIP